MSKLISSSNNLCKPESGAGGEVLHFAKSKGHNIKKENFIGEEEKRINRCE